ncbi:LuxR C-terminal-related transcriptional regulator [Streptomyces sp. NPDC048172]|uniref:LuxR C-terminal-related transcriptional regulator n=1 Tax=Streptomyces sp. NPDC048172 TaxID=3365505 RepID=UPI0037125D02
MCGNADEPHRPPSARLCAQGLDRYREAAAKGRISGEVPECLIRLGLVRPASDDPASYAPVPPDIALARHTRPVQEAILEQQQALLRVQDSYAEAEAAYHEAQRVATTSGRLLQGSATIYAALKAGSDSCTEEALTLQPGGGRPAKVLDTVLTWEYEMLGRGVRRRTLYQHSARSDGPTLAYMEKLTEAGGRFRTLDELFDRLVIYDRRVAFIPVAGMDIRENALVIEHPAIVDYLTRVFEHAWDRAEMVTFARPRSRPAPLTDVKRRAVLRLMVEGHTDQTIAARLGMSARTVANHVRAASDQLAARSRAQLAYRLAGSGLLEEPRDG